MKRVRILFAIPFLILLLPMWRFLDMLIFSFPHDLIFGISVGLVFFIFLSFPLRLIRKNIHWGFLITAPLLIGTMAWYSRPMSIMATVDPDFSHCGRFSYTGFFYPIRGALSAAHQDDLEIRNQLCWVRKMVTRILPVFSTDIEYTTYNKIIRDRLMKPYRKYRVSLPLLGLLYGNILHRWESYNIPLLKNINTGKLFLEEMNYWTREYTEEVNARDYGWWDYIHGNYIKWEYGFVENNWQNLMDGTFAK